MNFPAYGPLWAAAALMAAGSTEFSPNMSPEMLSGSVLAVLGWTIYYVFVKMLPAQQKAQKEQREAFLKLLRDLNLVKDKN